MLLGKTRCSGTRTCVVGATYSHGQQEAGFVRSAKSCSEKILFITKVRSQVLDF
jgi:hypothetical protein